MLSEKRLIPNKRICTKEIRKYISERKEIKKKLSRTSGISENRQQYLSHMIKRLDKIIDDKINEKKSVKMGLSANKISEKLKKRFLPIVLK